MLHLLSYIPLSVRDEANAVWSEKPFPEMEQAGRRTQLRKENHTGGKYEREFIGDAFPILLRLPALTHRSRSK